jgi:hypothetical protein
LLVAVAACEAVDPHRNFKDMMQLEVGRSIHDVHAFRNRYPETRTGTKLLPNGNKEEEFKAGRRHRCRVFFEIEPSAGKIVGWRYEGSQRDCSISV